MNKKKREDINFQINLIVWEVLGNENGNLFRTFWSIKDKDETKGEDEDFLNWMRTKMIPLVIENIGLKIRIKAVKEKWPKEIVKEAIDALPNIIDTSDEYQLMCRERVDIGCPCCKTRLIFIKRDRFETLVEHVGNPNGKVFKKDAFGCPNPKCDAHKTGKLWLENGEGPFGGYEKIKYINDNDAPFRTFNRSLNAEREKRITLFKNKWILLDVKISCKADNNGERSWNKKIKFEIATSKDGIGYIRYISGIHMFLFIMRQYAIAKNNRSNILLKDMNSICKWERTEWWRKLPLIMARYLWRTDYKIAESKFV